MPRIAHSARARLRARAGRGWLQKGRGAGSPRAGTGNAEPARQRLRSSFEGDLGREARFWLVGAHGAGHVDHMGSRRHALQIELADLLDVIEDLRELSRHALDLLFA